MRKRGTAPFSLAIWIGVAVLLVAIGFAWARASAAQTDDLDVLKVIPENYKLIIDNPFVRVLEARIPAGTEEKPHRHLKGVSVALTEYTLEARTLPDGQWVRNERKAGTTYWSDASLHQVRNVGKTESHTIRVELKH
jgi:beta-alanine degradation protein BauB